MRSFTMVNSFTILDGELSRKRIIITKNNKITTVNKPKKNEKERERQSIDAET